MKKLHCNWKLFFVLDCFEFKAISYFNFTQKAKIIYSCSNIILKTITTKTVYTFQLHLLNDRIFPVQIEMNNYEILTYVNVKKL